MLQIIAFIQKESTEVAVHIELGQNTQLDMIWENPLFNADQQPAAFSLAFNVPASAPNLKYFNYPDRVTSLSVHKKLPVIILFGPVVMARGDLFLIHYEKDLQLQFKGAIDTLDQILPLNQLSIYTTNHNVTFPEFPTATEVVNLDYTEAQWNTYRNNATNRASQAVPFPYCHAPVKRDDTPWDGHEGSRGLFNSVHKYINYFNPHDDGFHLGDPEKQHTPVVPFPPLHLIISAALGSNIDNNPFTTGDFGKIVVVNMNKEGFSTENLYRSIGYDGTTYYDPPIQALLRISSDYPNTTWYMKDFMQAVKFNEFFKDILKIFGLTLYRGLQNKLVSNNDTFDADDDIVSWDKLLDGSPKVEVQPEKDYIFEYAGETSDFEETIYERTNWQQVYAEAMLAETNEEFLYRVQDNPQILAITRTLRGLGNQIWLQSRIARSALHTEHLRAREENLTITSAVKPLNMSIEKYWWQNNLTLGQIGDDYFLQKKHWHVPVLPKKASKDSPAIMFFAGKKDTFEATSGQYPYLTNHHTDQKGNRLFDFSLLPSVTDGIIAKFHGKMKAWVEKEKIRVRGSFKLTPQQIKNTNMKQKVYLRGKLFFIEKIQFAITRNNVSKIDATLIEIKE